MSESEQAGGEVIVPAPAEQTWEALTDPDQLGEWLGEAGELELCPGGDLEIRVGGEERRGFFEEVDPGRRLVFWWRADDDDQSSRVEIDLEPDPDGTRVRVTETRPLRALDAPGDDLATLIGGGGAPQMDGRRLALAG